jgi:hypothetical protein
MRGYPVAIFSFRVNGKNALINDLHKFPTFYFP